MTEYYRFKWSVAARQSLVVGDRLGMLPWSWYASLAVGVGFACGIANTLAIMRGSERLVGQGNPVSSG